MPRFWTALRSVPAWCRAGRADLHLSHLRRLSPAYRAKQQIVKQVWMGAGMVMLIHPVLPMVTIISLFTTFVAFAILDETGDD